jgi:hypothetical protein
VSNDLSVRWWKNAWLEQGLSYLERQASLPSTRGLAAQALGAFSSLLNALGGLFLVVFVGLYLTASPDRGWPSA